MSLGSRSLGFGGLGLGLGIRDFRFGLKVSGALCLHNGSMVWGLHY